MEDANIPMAKSGVSIVNFLLPASVDVHAELVAEFSEATALAIARPMNLDALEAATIELLALERLASAESEKLSRDPIARTEIESRE